MKKLSSVIATSAFLIATGANGMETDYIIKDTKENNTSISKSNNPYQKIYTELDSYKELKNNWDGYGGVRPNDEIIITAQKFIDRLESLQIINPKIMVSGVGEIGLFWKNKNSYIEVDFDENEYFTYFYKINNEIYGEDDIALSQDIPDRLLHVLKNLQNQNSTKITSSLTNNLDYITSSSLIA